MPELPEVQTTVNGLNACVRNLIITNAWTDYDSQFYKGKDSIKDPVYFKYFRREIIGSKITHAQKIAKNILIHLEKKSTEKTINNVILIHMKMTGHLLYGKYLYNHKINKWSPAKNERPSLSDPYNRFTHLVISFSNKKHLVLSDMRKFAKITLIPENKLLQSIHLAEIGPDPLEKNFTFQMFTKRLDLRPIRTIKQVLMDQSIIAGVGNIYSDEALWQAGVHPEERVKNIPSVILKKIYHSLLSVLSKGINFGGDSMSDYRNIYGERGKFQNHHNVYQKKGEKCTFKAGGKVCRGTIIRKIVGGRSAHFCDTHQKLII